MSAASSRNRDSGSPESYAPASATMWSMVHRSLVEWGKHPPANLGLPTHDPAENLDENRGHEEGHDPHRAPIPWLAQTRSPTRQLHMCRWVTVSLALIGCLPFVPSNRVPSNLAFPALSLALLSRRSTAGYPLGDRGGVYTYPKRLW